MDVNPATWGGCVTDRDKPYNALRSPPNPDRETEKYRTKPCSFFELKLQPILPLTTDIALVRSRIASIEPWGLTNTTIGMAWGLNILNPSAPLGDAAAPASRKPIRMMVFLTDGLNNNDRFWQPFWDMDNDMRSLCRDARSSDVRIFTVRVVEGNDSLLRDCASDPVDFYQVNDADELEAVFRAIAGKIGETVKRLRLAS